MNRLDKYFNDQKPSLPPIPVNPPTPESPPERDEAIRVVPVIAVDATHQRKSTRRERLVFIAGLQCRSYILGCAVGYLLLFNGYSRDESFGAVILVAWIYSAVGAMNFQVRETYGSWRVTLKAWFGCIVRRSHSSGSWF